MQIIIASKLSDATREKTLKSRLEGCIETDAFHAFFECERWNEDRQELNLEVGRWTPDNIVEMMLSGSEYWYGVALFVEKVLKTKKSENP